MIKIPAYKSTVKTYETHSPFMKRTEDLIHHDRTTVKPKKMHTIHDEE